MIRSRRLTLGGPHVRMGDVGQIYSNGTVIVDSPSDSESELGSQSECTTEM